MAVGFLNQWFERSPRRDQVVVLDLGSRVTKAVWLGRQENIISMLGFACLDAPTGEKRLEPEAWREHFLALLKHLEATTTNAVLLLSADDSRLWHIDVPAAGVSDIRSLIAKSPKTFLQEEVDGHLFDCQILPAMHTAKPQPHTADAAAGSFPSPVTAEGSEDARANKAAPAPPQPALKSLRVPALVGAAKLSVVEMLRGAAIAAGLVVRQVGLGQVCPAAAFRSMPSSFQREAVALVDIGFHRSVITILASGVPLLTRVVKIGGDRFTSGLAETMGITYSVAEGIKQVMPEKVQSKLHGLIAPLAEELRASINFVEKEFEKTATEVFISGSSARSQMIIHLLERETIIPCKNWNPTAGLSTDLSAAKAEELAKAGPQLVDAVGGGIAWLCPEYIQLNLLAVEHEAEESRRRDPVRRGLWVAALCILAMSGWVGWTGFQFWRMDQRAKQAQVVLNSLQSKLERVKKDSRQAGSVEKLLHNLRTVTTNRFHWANALNALQFCVVDRVEITRLKLERGITLTPSTKTATNANNRITLGKPEGATEKIVLSLQAKDYGNPPLADLFIESLASHAYYSENLRSKDSIRLVERSPRQVDPLSPDRSFILFTIECYYAEKQFKGE